MADIEKLFQSLLDSINTSSSSLKSSSSTTLSHIANVAQRLDATESAPQQKYEEVSVALLNDKITSARRNNETLFLDRNQISVVSSHYQKIGSENIDWLVDKFPSLADKFLKSVLRDWNPSRTEDLIPFQQTISQICSESKTDGFLDFLNDIPISTETLAEQFALLFGDGLNLSELEKELLSSRYLKKFYNITKLVVGEYLFRSVEQSDAFFVEFIEKLKLHDSFKTILPTGRNTNDILAPGFLMIPLIGAIMKKAAYSGGKTKEYLLGELNHLRLTELGDPRSASRNPLWDGIESRIPNEYAWYLSSLNEEDIVFFFENLDGKGTKERKDFWLRYRKSFSRTYVILTSQKFKQLKTKYIGKDEKIDRALSQAKLFKYDQGYYALILVFNEYVCIEFHETGAACLTIPRRFFDKEILELIDPKVNLKSDENQKCSILNSGALLRLWRSVITNHKLDYDSLRWIHNGSNHQNWQSTFEERLAQNGIRPDPTNSDSSRKSSSEKKLTSSPVKIHSKSTEAQKKIVENVAPKEEKQKPTSLTLRDLENLVEWDKINCKLTSAEERDHFRFIEKAILQIKAGRTPESRYIVSANRMHLYAASLYGYDPAVNYLNLDVNATQDSRLEIPRSKVSRSIVPDVLILEKLIVWHQYVQHMRTEWDLKGIEKVKNSIQLIKSNVQLDESESKAVFQILERAKYLGFDPNITPRSPIPPSASDKLKNEMGRFGKEILELQKLIKWQKLGQSMKDPFELDGFVYAEKALLQYKDGVLPDAKTRNYLDILFSRAKINHGFDPSK